MAPFGKSFLKARQRNRTKDAEPVEGKEIQVTVCNEDKAICGVTKHTTCADMIQALLDDHKSIPESKRLLHGEAKDFCLVEHWKGFERALPPLTRILRLWFAWGDQRPFIQFTLVKTSDFVPQPAKKAGKSKGAKPKRWEHGRAQSAQPLPPERQKRMVKKAFRKLEKLHKESKSSPGAEEIDRMVQLILNQDHTIREQIQRMRGLDVGIEQFELEVQMEAAREISPPAQSLGAHAYEQPQGYPYTGSGVEQIELQLQRHQELILKLSRDIDAELRRDECGVGEREGAAAASQIPSETGELERLQDEVKRSLFTGVSLHNQAAEMSKQLMCYEAALVSKDQECWELAAQLSSLHIGEGGEEEEEEEESSPIPPKSETQCGVSSPPVKLKPGLSPLDVTDTDSDTGISSTHSQDSLSPCLDFPPPLDTDV
ncbi:ras association domain-containing protein 9 [Cyclopterus lumpus]|uniref:Ras association domain family member 9 n=1 Tax=Cyclopterus lumpus TaxID=8103 RepID=A0A8C2ZCD6_CYCLU|nr:ras association domain-containing protein 9 [Cyclopterus lumpus]